MRAGGREWATHSWQSKVKSRIWEEEEVVGRSVIGLRQVVEFARL